MKKNPDDNPLLLTCLRWWCVWVSFAGNDDYNEPLTTALHGAHSADSSRVVTRCSARYVSHYKLFVKLSVQCDDPWADTVKDHSSKQSILLQEALREHRDEYN